MRKLTFVSLLLLPLISHAGQDKVQPLLIGNMTLGSMNTGADYNFYHQHHKVETMGFYGGIAALFSNNFLVELGYSLQFNFDLYGAADGYDLSQKEVAVGYVLGNESFRFVPKIGRAFWDLSNTEGALFHSGPEERKSIDGDDTFVSIGVQIPFNDRTDLAASYKYMEPEFGSVKQFALGLVLKL